MTQIDRYKGALLGLAAGDALGTSIEFCPPGTFTPLTDMLGGGPFDLIAGQWTDDTSMALCLAESLILREGFDPIDQMKRYCLWYRQGHMSSNGTCFDIGNTVRAALHKFEAGGKNDAYCGSTDPNTAGNGSLMRLAPVPLAFAARPAVAIEQSGESSRTTHGAAVAVDVCRYMAALIVGALQGASKDELLSVRFCPEGASDHWRDHPLTAVVDAIAAGSYKQASPPQIKGTGYAAHALEAALWAFHNSTSFEEGCLKAANLGDDADTTAAIYGQLAGAFYGVEGIPQSWLQKLALKSEIEALAEGLLKLSAKVN
ncbi:MAG: ADP-ribosylglycohydrolase family protein [Cyanobacteria bacterium SZAS LIN-3]|nr:ADP-ribosylglycohydrolase family protein [Cyanobacteria bacterium SZAS LIN-3]